MYEEEEEQKEDKREGSRRKGRRVAGGLIGEGGEDPRDLTLKGVQYLSDSLE